MEKEIIFIQVFKKKNFQKTFTLASADERKKSSSSYLIKLPKVYLYIAHNISEVCVDVLF